MTAESQIPPNAASVALIEGARVLLIQRAYAPYRLFWTLPGGGLEPGETAADCAAREIREELGLAVSRLVHVETQSLAEGDGRWRLAVFATRRFGGKIVASDEIADLRWVRLAELGALRTTDGLHDVLERAFALTGPR